MLPTWRLPQGRGHQLRRDANDEGGLDLIAGVIVVAFETYLEATMTKSERRSFSATFKLCDPGPKFWRPPNTKVAWDQLTFVRALWYGCDARFTP
jgi:hypothetical protein